MKDEGLQDGLQGLQRDCRTDGSDPNATVSDRDFRDLMDRTLTGTVTSFRSNLVIADAPLDVLPQENVSSCRPDTRARYAAGVSMKNRVCPARTRRSPISGDQQVGLPTFGEVEERLVVFVPAGQLGLSCHLNYFAIGKVLSQ
jgi:hypothetical protein